MHRHRLTILGAAMTIVAAAGTGCGIEEPVPGATTTTSATVAQPARAPGIVIPDGRVEHIVDRVDQRAQELLRETGIPGMAVAIVADGKVVYQEGFGVREAGTEQQVEPDTVFQLASVSKPIGATVVAREVAAGPLEWDTPLRQFAPWFTLNDPYIGDHATVGDLYAHRSGLPDHAGDKLEDLGFDRAQVLQRLPLLPLEPFRAAYEYTNFGLTAAATAVAEAAHTDWADLSERAIYEPLGMTATSSRYADFAAAANRAVGHTRVGEDYRRTEPPRRPDAQSPAGGVSSSVVDMARWMTMVLGNGTYEGREVVAPDALLPAVSPQIVSAPPATPDARAGSYGYGFNVGTSAAGRVVLSHSGAFNAGAATAFTLIPSANVGIVTLTNAAPIGVPETLNAEFADLVQFGEVREDWWGLYQEAFAEIEGPTGDLVGERPPPNPAPAGPPAEYAGIYGNDYFGPAQVVADGDRLLLTLGPGKVTVPLRHWDGDTFVFTPTGEAANPGTISQARFDGDRLWLEFYDSEGFGTFTR